MAANPYCKRWDGACDAPLNLASSSKTKPSEVIGDSAVVARRTSEGDDSQPSKLSDTASSVPELAQSAMSDTTIRASQHESGVSKSKAGSDAAEEYVTLPM